MSQHFKPYLYFNGEKENPFNPIDQNPQFMFWSYEESFDALFGRGDFDMETWEHIAPDKGDKAELQQVLETKPVDKEELFKLFMFHILMVHLPDKAEEPTSDKFLKLYHESKP